MNVENIKRVRDVIASVEARRFDMASYARRLDGAGEPDAPELLHNCETSACICGWTVAVLGDGEGDPGNTDLARDALGLSSSEASALFYPRGWLDADYSQSHAVAVLDHLIATGKVDWRVAKPRSSEAAQVVQPIRDETRPWRPVVNPGDDGMEELKPCPFCGGVGRLSSRMLTASRRWWVTCGCADKLWPSTAEAIAAWNRRSDQDDKDRALDRIVNGDWLGQMRFAEDSDADFLLRVIAEMRRTARSALQSSPGDTK